MEVDEEDATKHGVDIGKGQFTDHASMPAVLCILDCLRRRVKVRNELLLMLPKVKPNVARNV